jgi:O-antigen/teichoic acid export membrane protein
MAARTLAFAFSFGLPLLLVRRLDQHQFGLYKQVFLLVMTAINVLPLGVEMSAFYFLPRMRERRERSRIVCNILLFYLATTGIAGLVLCACPSLLSGLFNNPELIEIAPLVAILIPLWGAPFVLETVAIAHQETRLASTFIVVAELSKTIVLVSACLISPSMKTLLMAAIIHGGLQAVILMIYVGRRYGRLWKSFDWLVMREQLSYALPFGFAAILFRLQTDLHNYFVSHNFSPEAYAIYSIGCFNLPLISILGYSVGAVMIPRVNDLEERGERREIVKLVARMMRKMAAIYFPIYLFLLVAGREFITVLFTEQYRASWPIFALNLTLIPLGIITTANDAVMRAHAEHRFFLVKLRLVLIPLLLAVLWFATSRFGLVGAIAAVVAASIAEASATGFKATRILGVVRGDVVLLKDVGKLAASAIAAGIVGAVARSLMQGTRPLLVLISSGIVFSLVYLAAAWMTGVISSDERAFMRRSFAAGQRAVRWNREARALIEEA